jgi:hypothetical protein
MQLKQTRREEKMVVNERREAMESIYRYGGVVVGDGGVDASGYCVGYL